MISKKPEAPVAHTPNEKGEWHLLQDHLMGVAETAKKLGEKFGAGEWAELAGWWHDLGKFSPSFQNYLFAQLEDHDAHIEHVSRVDHSSAGARYAIDRFAPIGRILAYLIAGHHAGLPDWHGENAGRASLSHRLEKKHLLEAAKSGGIPEEVLARSLPSQQFRGGSKHLWLRMLFSCLADADFLDTEKHFRPEQAEGRRIIPDLSPLKVLFNTYMANKLARVQEPGSLVNRSRAEVLDQCRNKARLAPGLFSLNVPTGGGKTLSSMAFALDHATDKSHPKDRVIYVIPYTSIIEQTASQFREIFGEAVIEHHSNFDPDQETNASRLASENWDAPIIVTTSVQFFESLFTARPSRARKLHNIVNSVVILDEVQLLPPDYLDPILQALRDLTSHYGVTVVLCTATQPALKPREGFGWKFAGLQGIREIVDEPAKMHQSLRRTQVILPPSLDDAMDWPDIAAELAGHEKVLCIVNSRTAARDLYRLMPEGSIHLSALMCGEHRSKVIADIRQRLEQPHPLRVISTQLVEAGVDLDFPVVYRALAGLDSIAQAAGRCNREGKRPLESSRVVVFVPPKPPPAGLLLKGEQATRELLLSGLDDALSPEAFTRYFEKLYWSCNSLDREKILELLDGDRLLQIQFRTACERFRFIENRGSAPIVVQYGESEKWISALGREGASRNLRRKLQRYSVTIPECCRDQLLRDAELEEVIPGVFWQRRSALYDDRLGFIGCEGVPYHPAELIG